METTSFPLGLTPFDGYRRSGPKPRSGRRTYPGPASGEDLTALGFELETAWRKVVPTIVEEHNRRADPRYAEERIGPVQRFALDLLRDPAVAPPHGAGEAAEALSVERSSSVRHALGEVRTQVHDGLISRDDAAARIVDVVDAFGLRRVEPPPPLETIDEDEVGVVCWMAVLPES
jgi:hypothetical protein